VTTSTTTSRKSNASSIFNPNNAGNQLNNILANYTGDLSACLSNCSNQGICKLNSLQQYICECNQYKTGAACQSDSRPCSNNPCLNNATCLNVMNQTKFQCECSNPNLYFGIYCENKFDLCQNSSVCFNNQGYCIVNGTQPMCKCLMGYSGVNCEILSTALAAKKVITKTTTIFAIIVMVCFVMIVIFFDYTKFFLMKNEKKNKNNKKNEDEKKHEKMI
jgi:hypothetical protein